MVFAYCLVEIGKLQVTDKDNKGVLINLIKILAGLNWVPDVLIMQECFPYPDTNNLA